MRIEISYPKLFINDKLVGYLKSPPVFFEDGKPSELYRGRPRRWPASRLDRATTADAPYHYDEQLICEFDWLDSFPPSKIEKLDLPHKKVTQRSESDKQKIPKPKNRKIKL